MALDGSGVEPRDGNGSYKIVLHFDRPIQSGTATVSSGTGSAGTVSFSGNDMLVDLNGVTNAQRVTLTANNVGAVSGGVLSSVNVTIGFLIGDTNGNGVVHAVTLVCRPATPEARAHVPFTIVLVDAAEGFRMMAHGDRDLKIGDAVTLRFTRFIDRLVPYFAKSSS